LWKGESGLQSWEWGVKEGDKSAIAATALKDKMARLTKVMKRTLEMERVNCAACGLVVQACQQAFIVAKKGRKAFPSFSKNPLHSSKNFPALTLNFRKIFGFDFLRTEPSTAQTESNRSIPRSAGRRRRIQAHHRRSIAPSSSQ
jgi:hypothetical protein